MENQEQNKSRLTRITVSISAEYQFKKNKGNCLITDISEGGIAIEANQIFVEGDLLRIICNPSKHLNIDIWCKVQNIQGRKIGLQFEEISNQMRADLEYYIFELLDLNKKNKHESFHR